MKPYSELTRLGKIRRLRCLCLAALESYDLQLKRLIFFTIETNTMFRVDTIAGEKLVLRIYSDDGTTMQDNLVEMYWLAALKRDTDLLVSEPVANRDGNYITIASVPGVPAERRCALFRWVPGRPLEDYLTGDNYYKLGRIMARLHDHAERMEYPPDLQPKRWDKLFYFPDEPVLYNKPEYRHIFKKDDIVLIDRVISQAGRLLKDLFKNESDRIWIHGDLHYWNVHYHRGDLYVFDFEDITSGYQVQDVAITLFYGRDRDLYPELRQAFKDGYSSFRPWPVASRFQLETLIAARIVNFINYILRISEDPADYIQRRCQDLREYLDEFPEK